MTHLSTMPAEDRPRERLLTHGIDSLSEADLLALVLRSGSRDVSALDAGAALLEKYGSLGGVAVAPVTDLAAAAGLGPAKAASLAAAFRLGSLVAVSRGAGRRRRASPAGLPPAAPG